MNFLPEAARTIGSFVLVLGVLVFIHEMGALPGRSLAWRAR